MSCAGGGGLWAYESCLGGPCASPTAPTAPAGAAAGANGRRPWLQLVKFARASPRKAHGGDVEGAEPAAAPGASPHTAWQVVVSAGRAAGSFCRICRPARKQTTIVEPYFASSTPPRRSHWQPSACSYAVSPPAAAALLQQPLFHPPPGSPRAASQPLFVDADRSNISTAIIPMAEQYSWDKSAQGVVLSAFFAGYLCTQVQRGRCDG